MTAHSPQAGEASQVGQAPQAGQASARRRGALLIEDTRLDYVATRGILLAGQSGINAVDWLQAWPGAEEALRIGPHEVFLVDLHLGSVSGLTIIAELRAAGVLAPIIALTGTATDEIDRACTAAGASDFLVKGEFDSRALDRAIRYATRSAAVHRELDRVNAVLERRVSAEADHARLMRFAIEQSADPIFISTAGARLPDLIVVYANAALCTLLGRRSGALLGIDAGSLFGIDEAVSASTAGAGTLPPQPPSHEAETLQRVLAEGQRHATQLPMQGPSGVFRAAVRASPLRAASGEVTHLVWTCHDLGEQQRAGEEERQREKLQAIGQLAGGVAHDFNNLLTAVLGNLELLGRQITEPRPLRLLQGAARAAERGASLAQQLLEFARSGDNEVRSLALDVVLEDMRDLLARSLGGLIQLDFEIRHEPGGCWTVLAAPESLQLAILNLAVRGRDAMPGGGTLRIACENVPAGPGRPADLAPGQDYVEITASYTGTAPETPSRTRGHAAATSSARGRGLSQVAATVRQAGGVMLVDSTPGKGSTVRLFLPRAETASPPPAGEPPLQDGVRQEPAAAESPLSSAAQR